MILTVDAGGTFVKYGFIDESGELGGQGSVPTPRMAEGASKEDFLAVVRTCVAASPASVEGVAMSLPGTIDPVSGHIYQGGSLGYHNGVDIVSWYERELGVSVAVENDARCAALAEMGRGSMRGVENGIVLTLGTGVGCAFIIGGDIYRGSHLFSGEISASIFGDLGREGAGAILGHKLGIGHFCECVCVAKGLSAEDGRTVFSWIEAGDETACRLWGEYCSIAAVELFNLQLTFDPERVALGGGVSANPQFVPGIVRALEAFYDRLPMQIPHLDVVRCEFCNDANLLGAYENFRRRCMGA